jgi:hypothetical protein
MNSDPLLVGVDTVFPNQNLSTAPTVWEEDTDQAAQQGIPWSRHGKGLPTVGPALAAGRVSHPYRAPRAEW